MENSKLKEVRDKLNENQDVFAKRLGITQSYYSAVERGEKAITAKILEKLFKNVGVSSDWWYNSNGNIFSSNLSGENVGFDVGLEEKRLIHQSAIRRFEEELKDFHPELLELYQAAFKIIDFQYFLKEFNPAYLRQILFLDAKEEPFIEDEKFNYNNYSKARLESLQKIKDLGPAIQKLATAIMQFYSEFAPLDSKNVMGKHFPGLKGK